MQIDLASELKGITTVLERAEELSAYAVDGQTPTLVALASSEAEVAACLQIAARHNATVVPRGAGTKGDLGNLPKRIDLVLSLERLNQVVEYVPADLTVTVQAGMKFADLQELVARNGQTVPIDPARSAGATVGGIVASGGYGPRRMAYGSIRDLLLGTRLALTDGRVVKTGGRVVKNVAGYDMNKLLVGSLGTLGVITEVSLKLLPLPQVTRTLRYGFSDLATALESAEAVLNSELLPVGMAVLTTGAAQRVGAPGMVTLAVDLAETAPNVAYQVERLREITGKASTVDELTGPEAEAFWDSVRNYGDKFGTTFRAKVNTVVSDLETQLKVAMYPQAGMAMDGIAYVGTGTVLVYGFDQGAGAADLAKAANAFFGKAARAGGSAVIESASLAMKQHLDVWGPKRPEWKIVDGIKQALDPGRVLNTGRYVGGI